MAALTSRIRQGYDGIYYAGTGYEKSLQILAVLGGKGRMVIVISLPAQSSGTRSGVHLCPQSIRYAKVIVLRRVGTEKDLFRT